MVTVSFWDMFVDLATIIFIPFILAQVVARYCQSAIEKIAPLCTPISLLCLGLLITGIIGQQILSAAGFSLSDVTSNLLAIVMLLVSFQIVGFFLAFWRNVTDRITISICLTYMNFSLAIYLATEFFADPTTTLTLVVAVIPWVLLLPIFRFFSVTVLRV